MAVLLKAPGQQNYGRSSEFCRPKYPDLPDKKPEIVISTGLNYGCFL
jgi:hypothetical protein